VSATDPTLRALQQLYAVPPSAFVRERDAAAAALKNAGHTAGARSVRRLRKPSATLWATNQLARTEATRLAAFLDSVDHLRTAQLRDPLAAAAALRRQRGELEALVQRASALLATQGAHATAQARQRISNTLLGAAVDRRLAVELRQGRLRAEVTAPGFEVLAGVPRAARRLHLVVPPRQAAPAPKGEPDTDLKAEATRKAEATERARRQQEADELERALAARQETADRLAREVADLGRSLAAARERLRVARRAATIAAAAARKARRALS
jgi:hypothetical protein